MKQWSFINLTINIDFFKRRTIIIVMGYTKIEMEEFIMIKTLKDLIDLAKDKEKKVLSVAVAQDREVLISVIEAVKLGIVDAILVGDIDKIEAIAKEESLNINNITIIDEKIIKKL